MCLKILIDRIRKYKSKDITQLLNSPNDEDTNIISILIEYN